jgi:hypothetical protein
VALWHCSALYSSVQNKAVYWCITARDSPSLHNRSRSIERGLLRNTPLYRQHSPSKIRQMQGRHASTWRCILITHSFALLRWLCSMNILTGKGYWNQLIEWSFSKTGWWTLVSGKCRCDGVWPWGLNDRRLGDSHYFGFSQCHRLSVLSSLEVSLRSSRVWFVQSFFSVSLRWTSSVQYNSPLASRVHTIHFQEGWYNHHSFYDAR